MSASTLIGTRYVRWWWSDSHRDQRSETTQPSGPGVRKSYSSHRWWQVNWSACMDDGVIESESGLDRYDERDSLSASQSEKP